MHPFWEHAKVHMLRSRIGSKEVAAMEKLDRDELLKLYEELYWLEVQLFKLREMCERVDEEEREGEEEVRMGE